MKDLWYLQHKEWFSNLAFQAFEKYFNSRSQFDAFVNSIVGDEEKSRFLKVASHYKFLVKDGRFSVDGYEEAKYFDETFDLLPQRFPFAAIQFACLLLLSLHRRQ